MEKKKKITIEVSDEMHKKIKIFCAQHGMSLKDLIIKLLDGTLKALEN